MRKAGRIRHSLTIQYHCIYCIINHLFTGPELDACDDGHFKMCLSAKHKSKCVTVCFPFILHSLLNKVVSTSFHCSKFVDVSDDNEVLPACPVRIINIKYDDIDIYIYIHKSCHTPNMCPLEQKCHQFVLVQNCQPYG